MNIIIFIHKEIFVLKCYLQIKIRGKSSGNLKGVNLINCLVFKFEVKQNKTST